MSIDSRIRITTTEMHSAGEPLRIIETGYPPIQGDTILDKRRYVRTNLDHFRRFLMFEPRGHYDMYGAILVEPDHPEADIAVLFLNNEGYSTMCGHATLALGRYAVDRGLAKRLIQPETPINVQCPCGLVRAFVEYDGRKTGKVRFHSVPAFAFALDESIEVNGRSVSVDIGYGGAFYALVTDRDIGVDLKTSPTSDIVRAATAVSDAVKAKCQLFHPDNEDLAFLYGTIVTDGASNLSETQPTVNLTIFANKEVDRAPTGSGVTARMAVLFARRQVRINETRIFESAANGSRYTGKVVEETRCGRFESVVVEVGGSGFYSGSSIFTAEDEDELKGGFLLKQ